MVEWGIELKAFQLNHNFLMPWLQSLHHSSMCSTSPSPCGQNIEKLNHFDRVYITYISLRSTAFEKYLRETNCRIAANLPMASSDVQPVHNL